ncbi:MAG TPA: MFS transporter [Candidatus Acidoferrales bacterium]|nr:MFS transporter [Candidatus Acidoferrales bacterium]
MAATETTMTGGRVALTHRNFRLYLLARSFIVFAVEMQSVAVGWQVYEITRRALDLGLIGLVQFLPGMMLFLVSGHTADRLDRQKLLATCYSGYALCSGLLLLITVRGAHSAGPIYAVMAMVGVVRSFNAPAMRALLPQLIPEEHFPNAVAWSSITFKAVTILGPALGGFVYAFFRGPSGVYAIAAGSGIFAALELLRIRVEMKPRPREAFSLETVLVGIRYIWRQKVVLGSISLDLFAVLLGGAVALLPVYARDILKTGPWGLGLLRCAPAIGAAAMAILLAYRPLRNRAGATMLWCVAGFGLFTVIFGLSRSLTLSIAALVLVGATDMVSVIVRAVFVQLATPDEMRGRVNAVDMVFIGASNELGEFESGITAQWFGTVPAVVLGGIGTLAVTALWTWAFPELRRADRLVESAREQAEAVTSDKR